jgi:serine protease Do
MDSSKLWTQARRGRSVIALSAAALLGAGAARALATGAPPAPAPAAAPAASKVTPKTERPPEARALSSAFAATAKALRPSVVRIDVEVGPPRLVQNRRAQPGPQGPQDFDGIPPMFRRFFDFGGGGGPDDDGAGPAMPGHGTGSGVIIDVGGDVVTNSHVVENARKITVTLEGGDEIPAKLVGRDPRTDLALVRLERVPAKLVAARIGNSDQLEVGEWVLAIGSPLGLDQTVTAGIVSGKGHVGRHVQMSGERVRTYIQTDAKINPGNSGGPLVDLEGEVVGINTLINTGPGGAYGFAIPINEVTRVVHTLLADGRVRYPYLGVRVGDVAGMPANEKQKLGANPPDKGAFVGEVTAGSPAAAAGLRAGDVITRVDGRAVEIGSDVVDAVSSHAIGDKVAVDVVRDGKHQTLRVALGEMPGDDRVASEEAAPVGMALQTLTPDVASSLGLPSGTHGAAVTDVTSGGAAARAGIKPGDVVVEVDRKPVANAEDAAAALRQQHAGGHLVRVLGENGARFVTVPTA